MWVHGLRFSCRPAVHGELCPSHPLLSVCPSAPLLVPAWWNMRETETVGARQAPHLAVGTRTRPSEEPLLGTSVAPSAGTQGRAPRRCSSCQLPAPAPPAALEPLSRTEPRSGGSRRCAALARPLLVPHPPSSAAGQRREKARGNAPCGAGSGPRAVPFFPLSRVLPSNLPKEKICCLKEGLVPLLLPAGCCPSEWEKSILP